MPGERLSALALIEIGQRGSSEHPAEGHIVFDQPGGAHSSVGASRGASTLDVPPGVAGLLGIEQEFLLHRGISPVDFRDLIHSLEVPGVRLDPGDVNAYRLASGFVLTCDDEGAEIAAPPLRVRAGFTRRAERMAAGGASGLVALLPPDVAAEGYSTHLSVAMPEQLSLPVHELYARTFGPALTMLFDRAESYGVYVRPRPGRLEFCGEYVNGDQLRAAAAFAVGSAMVCVAFVRGGRPVTTMPPKVRVALTPPASRQGVAVLRGAFDTDIHAAGRSAILRREEGGTMTAQEHLDEACRCALIGLDALRAAPEDIRALIAEVAGCEPLLIEQGTRALPAGPPLRGSSTFGAVIRPRTSPRFTALAVIATWDFTVFQVHDGSRTVFVSIPRNALAGFIRAFELGRLDPELAAQFEYPSPGGTLISHSQVQAPGVFESMGAASALLPTEPATPGPLAQGSQHASGKRGRVGKQGVPVARQAPAAPALPISDRPQSATSSGPCSATPHRPMWPLLVTVTTALVALAFVVAIARGGGTSASVATPTPPSEKASPLPSQTTDAPAGQPSALPPTRVPASPSPCDAAVAGCASPAATQSPAPGCDAASASCASPAAVPTPRETRVPTDPTNCDLALAGCATVPAPTATISPTATVAPTQTPTPTATVPIFCPPGTLGCGGFPPTKSPPPTAAPPPPTVIPTPPAPTPCPIGTACGNPTPACDPTTGICGVAGSAP